MTTKTLVELCAGTASVSLWALGRCVPLTGYMGSKRRWAATLVDALDARDPDRVVLVDKGPWGEVWAAMRDRDARRATAEVLRSWQPEDPAALWRRLLVPPPDQIEQRVAQYLWLQARSAGTIPIWYSPERERWESPTGARTEQAHQRGNPSGSRRTGKAYMAHGYRGDGAMDASKRMAGVMNAAGRQKGGPPSKAEVERAERRVGRPAQKGGAPTNAETERAELRAPNVHQVDQTKVVHEEGPGARWRAGCRGIQSPGTIATRIHALDRIDWSRVEVVYGDVFDVAPFPATVYCDPPYLDCPRYAAVLPRARVLELARAWHDAGARVVLSEGEPLPLDGWTMRQLKAGTTPTGGGGRVKRAEWLTANFPIVLEEQLDLLAPRPAEAP